MNMCEMTECELERVEGGSVSHLLGYFVIGLALGGPVGGLVGVGLHLLIEHR